MSDRGNRNWKCFFFNLRYTNKIKIIKKQQRNEAKKSECMHNWNS